MIRCLITDGSATADPRRWLDRIARWIRERVDLVQIRERDLPARELAALTRRVLALPNREYTKILINDRADIAIACGADGLHLRDGSIDPARFRRPGFTVSASCHDPHDASRFSAADYVLLGPIFHPLSKLSGSSALGVDSIREFVHRSSVPVLALGGITDQNAGACQAAGAAGIAGITYFS